MNEHKELKLFSNDALLSRTRELVAEERKLTTRILWYIREIDERRLFAQRGYPSLFELCVREFNYSEATAHRRIEAMRLIRELPEIEKKLEQGALKLGQVSQIQGFLRAEKREQKRVYSLEEKRDLVSRVEGMSTRETERELISISPQSAGIRERERAVSATETEIRFIADKALLEKLKKLQELGSHRFKDRSRYAELFHWLADLGLAELGSADLVHPEKMKPSSIPRVESKAVPTRHIPTRIKALVRKRDLDRCTFVDPKTGRKCGSRYLIQIDHIQPFALGGSSNAPANLRLLCFQHNQLEAERWFG